MVISVNDYKQIRQRYLNGESQRSIAKSMGISRNTVKKYCEGENVPWERKTPEREASVLTEDVLDFITSCLEEDEAEGLKKQRHTARRIFDRLVEEKGFEGGESTIRRAVHEIRGKMPQAFVPLQFDPADAIQVDWGEATVYLNGKVAVKEGFGAHARMQEGYSALSAHYGFDAVFCNPAEGHEKGLVEGLVGWARRNICVPVPKVTDMQDLNYELLARCLKYENHKIRGKKATVGEMFQEEKRFLRRLPPYIFETAKCMNVRVNAFSTVRFKTNTYSVPVKYVGYEVSVKGYPETVEIYYKGELLSTHTRLVGKNLFSYHLDHYMPLLRQRPRAIFDAAPVKQNIPPEVLEELKAQKKHDNVINLLEHFAAKTAEAKPVISDPVIVRPVDLHQYDALRIGKEVN